MTPREALRNRLPALADAQIDDMFDALTEAGYLIAQTAQVEELARIALAAREWAAARQAFIAATVAETSTAGMLDRLAKAEVSLRDIVKDAR